MFAKIEKLVPGGQGLGVLEDGKKAFVWNALPGEQVEFNVAKDKRSYCEGVAYHVFNCSEYRIMPKDKCFLATSPWQIMDYNYELMQKRELVRECFLQNHILVEPEPTKTDNKDFFYRNKMEYSLYWNNDDGKIYPAFHERGTHRKVPIEQSSIERPEIWAKASEIIAKLNAEHAEARKYQSLLIRCDQQGNTSGDLFVNGQPHPIMNNLTDKLCGQEYSYSPNGFFQINLPVYEMVLNHIKQHISTNKVLDLYSGVGSIGLTVARDKELTLVEVNGAAYEEMQKNAEGTDAKCVLAKSEDVTEYVAPDQTVILDPPRAGCDAKLIEKLNEIKPKSIIYLSCNPITQARDIAMLQENYAIKEVTPYNFFPRTPHIESLAILVRK